MSFQRQDPADRGYRAIAERHTRIRSPVGLSTEEIDSLVDYALSRVGGRYDLKNIFDLTRYLIQRPPVTGYWRRRLLSIGSGDPTRATCSSFIAQAFHSVSYPILTDFVRYESAYPRRPRIEKEHAHIRLHSFFAPCDFDLSPYFEVIKPTVEYGFNP